MSLEHDSYAFAGQLGFLHKCATTISRLLRDQGSPLLAAKILVISRLLHKTLSQHQETPPFLENLRNQLASLRRNLLKLIDRQLAAPNSTTDDLVQAMCAFCLATSSSSVDVLRHFHHVRNEGIDFQLKSQDLSHMNSVRALKLYVRTLQSVKALLPRRLSEALGSLRSHPLMKDPEIQNLDGLSLNLHERWIVNEVLNFTPWIKSDDLSKREAEAMMKDWSTQASEDLVTGLKNNLEGIQDIAEVLVLRKLLLDVWLQVQGSILAHSSPNVLDGLRKAINNHLISLLRAQTNGLAAIGIDLSATVATRHIRGSWKGLSLWDASITAMDFSTGAEAFKRALIDRSLGRNDLVLRILKDYESWQGSISNSQSLIEGLKHVRWEDSLEEDEDDDLGPDSTATMLNQEDPDLLEREQTASLREAFLALEKTIADILRNFTATDEAQQAAFLLRIIREIRRSTSLNSTGSDSVFGLFVVSKLHQIIATCIVEDLPITRFTRILVKSGNRGRSLWDGDPPLPVQPSPATFKLLRCVVTAMADAGSDLWSTAAVDEVKTKFRKSIAEEIDKRKEIHLQPLQVNGVDSHDLSLDHVRNLDEAAALPNGDSFVHGNRKRVEQTDALRDGKIHLLFDILYLQEACMTRSSAAVDDSFQNLVHAIQEDSAVDEVSINRLKKGAEQYWKRTSLLFGLLTSEQSRR